MNFYLNRKDTKLLLISKVVKQWSDDKVLRFIHSHGFRKFDWYYGSMNGMRKLAAELVEIVVFDLGPVQ